MNSASKQTEPKTKKFRCRRLKKRLLSEVAVDREVALCNSGQVPVNGVGGGASWGGRVLMGAEIGLGGGALLILGECGQGQYGWGLLESWPIGSTGKAEGVTK